MSEMEIFFLQEREDNSGNLRMVHRLLKTVVYLLNIDYQRTVSGPPVTEVVHIELLILLTGELLYLQVMEEELHQDQVPK